MQTPSAGGPFTITISDGEPVILTNILIGEVWLCSGQSNMEMPVKGFRGQPVKGSCDAIATSLPSDDIRMVTLKINSSQILLDGVQPRQCGGFQCNCLFLCKLSAQSLKSSGRCHLLQLGWFQNRIVDKQGGIYGKISGNIFIGTD